MSASRWQKFAFALSCVACAPSSATPQPVLVSIEKPAARAAAVDPVPVNIRALEQLASSSEPGSSAQKVASERLAALLPLSRPTPGRPLAERTQHAGSLSSSSDESARRTALFAIARAYQRAHDSQRARQVFSALVCSERYSYPVAVDGNGVEVVTARPEDHDKNFWGGWSNRHQAPLDQVRRSPKAGAAKPADRKDELSYRTIFGPGCPSPKSVDARTPKAELHAQAWLSIGMLYAFEPSPEAGPYRHRRGLEAFERARDWAVSAGDAELALAATLWVANQHFVMQRYEAAARLSIEFLGALDGFASPGLREVLERRPAYLIASGFTYVDFTGPPLDDPYVVRGDTLDFELDPLVAEQKLHVGLDRLQDPAVVPQERRWLSAIYLALIDEYATISQHLNLIDTASAFLLRFPSHPEAPAVKERIADSWAEMSRLAAEQSPARVEGRNRADAALTEIGSTFGIGSAWAKANAKNARALTRAREVVRRAQTELDESLRERKLHRDRNP